MGVWRVKPGMVEDFVKTWQASAEWLVENHPGGISGEGVLLQEIEGSREFISLGWSTMPEKTEELVAGAAFQSFMTRLRELCEEFQPHKMQVVGYADSQ